MTDQLKKERMYSEEDLKKAFQDGQDNMDYSERSINVVSLFNGMGTLRQAFHNLGIKVNNYYSSEIKTYAIKLQQHHFPDVIQV